jgi:uncharacterized BrkB/YihY/UPF0761 family membrane protein
MSPAAFGVLVGTLGAVLQEVLYWYNAKTKLDTDEYRTILTSTRYWCTIVAMVIGSGFASYIWFMPEHQSPRTYLLFGAAFPVFFKKAVDAFIAKDGHLGTDVDEESKDKKPIMKSYFGAS